jgi:putative transposase
MEEIGVNVDHATLNRWVIRYAPAIAAKAHSQKRNTNRSWRMDEFSPVVLVGWSFDSHVVPSLKCPVNSPVSVDNEVFQTE